MCLVPPFTEHALVWRPPKPRPSHEEDQKALRLRQVLPCAKLSEHNPNPNPHFHKKQSNKWILHVRENNKELKSILINTPFPILSIHRTLNKFLCKYQAVISAECIQNMKHPCSCVLTALDIKSYSY